MKANMPRSHGFLMPLVSILFVSLTLMANPVASNAQTPYLWSLPEQIPEYYYLARAPLMVADENHSVHAFNIESLDGIRSAVMYRTWSLEQGWSSPVDILLFTGGGSRLLDVILDEQGVLNLLYFEGAQQAGEIYLSTAQAWGADHSAAWSHPILITNDAGPLADAQLFEAGSNRLVVVFAGQRYGSGIYEIHSNDRGVTWSTASLLQRSSEEDLNPGGIRVTLDSEDYTHVVWHMANVSGLVEETWYARLTPDLSTWEFLQRLSLKDDEEEFNGEPNIVLAAEEVIVVYHDDFPPTRFMRRSTDSGVTWSDPAQPFPHTGGYGPVSLVKDSLGTVHILLGNRLQNPEIHGMWYSRLLGNAWLPLDPIISGPATDYFDPSWPEAVVVQGNILLATWSNDVGLEYRSAAWFSYAFLDAPELSVELLPSPVAIEDIPTSLPVSIKETQVPQATNPPQYPRSFKDVLLNIFRNYNPSAVVFLGGIPVILLVLGVLINHNNHRRS